MTQKQRILAMLKAHPEGIRSDSFFKNFMPRAAARIQELKDEGFDITSEREGKFVLYRLIVGIGTEGHNLKQASNALPSATFSLDSGAEAPVKRPAPSNGYETWEG